MSSCWWWLDTCLKRGEVISFDCDPVAAAQRFNLEVKITSSKFNSGSSFLMLRVVGMAILNSKLVQVYKLGMVCVWCVHHHAKILCAKLVDMTEYGGDSILTIKLSIETVAGLFTDTML